MIIHNLDYWTEFSLHTKMHTGSFDWINKHTSFKWRQNKWTIFSSMELTLFQFILIVCDKHLMPYYPFVCMCCCFFIWRVYQVQSFICQQYYHMQWLSLSLYFCVFIRKFYFFMCVCCFSSDFSFFSISKIFKDFFICHFAWVESFLFWWSVCYRWNIYTQLYTMFITHTHTSLRSNVTSQCGMHMKSVRVFFFFLSGNVAAPMKRWNFVEITEYSCVTNTKTENYKINHTYTRTLHANLQYRW